MTLRTADSFATSLFFWTDSCSEALSLERTYFPVLMKPMLAGNVGRAAQDSKQAWNAALGL
jgi:hypothetical protein